jgi:signal transduction histidine kinase
MTYAHLTRTILSRSAAFVVTALVVATATGGLAFGSLSRPLTGDAVARFVWPVLGGYFLSVVVGCFLLSKRRTSGSMPLILLAGDILAIGALGTALQRGAAPDGYLHLVLPFLSGFTVGVLVASVGRRPVAALLGALAGAMVMGLGAALVAVLRSEEPDFVILAHQFVLLAAATVECAVVTGWIEAENDRRRTAERVEREVRAREAEGAELVTFTQALATSGSLTEIAEALVRHLRFHLPVAARALAIEGRGELAALWEESGRLEAEHVEERRRWLQQALARTGSTTVLHRMDARSAGTQPRPVALDFATSVEVPVQAAGRVAGVLFVGDPRSGAIPEPRIGLLADMVRRTGEAIVRIERHREEEQRRTALLLRHMREGVLLLGPDGQVLLANPAATEALRGSSDEGTPAIAIGGVSLADLARTPPGATRRFRVEVRPPGEARPLSIACSAVAVLDAGRRVGTLVTLTDVTEEEVARERLVLAEKMTLVGQTLAGVAHELNNPLAAMVGFADLLEGRKVPEEIERPIRQIREQAVRAARIVRNLLNFARKRNPERLATKVGDLIQSVVDLFAYEIRLANIVVAVDVPGDFPTVLGDKHSLQQVLVNLVQNAIHALQEWSGERRLAVTARELPGEVVISVRDSGPGVPHDLRARVFEPFFTTKGVNRGTGLGLALSRGIARDHGGDLLLEPEEGRGACFTLRLPLPRAVPAGAAGTETRQGLSLGMHLLVVDDEAPVREALVAQLGRMGCRVDSAADAAEGLRLASRTGYDAILCDVRMPGTTGFEFHEALGAQSPRAAGRVVFMTGDFANEEVTETLARLGRPHLEKPFTYDEMARILRSVAA